MERDRPYLAKLSPELRLLVLAAGEGDVDGALRAAATQPGLDWELVIALADFERATAIVWRRISRDASAIMPADQRQKFEQMAMIADFNSSLLEQRASDTLATLSRAGIDATVLKGVALAVSVYGSFLERPMGDIDLLVDAARAQDAWRVVQSAGWKWDAGRYPSPHYVGHAHLPPLLDTRAPDLRLELHASLFVAGSPFLLSGEELRARGTVMPVGNGGGRAVVPCREHLLLHICIHLAWSHMMSFGAWRAFRDVIALTNAGIDWELFEAEARRNRAESCAYWTLRFTERLAGGRIPEATMRRLSGATSSVLRRAAERHFEREIFPIELHCPSQVLRRLLWEAGIQPKKSSHGIVRPWVLDEAGSGHGDDEGKSNGGREVVRGLAGRMTQVGDLWRYLRMLTR